MPKHIMDPLDLWTQELQKMKATPAAQIPESRFEEFRAHLDLGLALIAEAAVAEAKLDGFMRETLLTFMRFDLGEAVKTHVMAAARCGVYERRAPNGPHELAYALLEDGPHNRERTYPVPQPRTVAATATTD